MTFIFVQHFQNNQHNFQEDRNNTSHMTKCTVTCKVENTFLLIFKTFIKLLSFAFTQIIFKST